MFAQSRSTVVFVANNIIQMATPRSGKSALDEFLPERVFTPDVRRDSRTDGRRPDHIPATEILLDPIEQVASTVVVTKQSPVQLWPMLAAAFVALGVSLLVLALFAKYTHLAS